MTRRRKSSLGLAVAAVTAVALTGCAVDTSSPPGHVSVLDSYGDGNDNVVIGATLEACGRELGVTIDRTSVPGSSLIQKTLQQASSRTLPDVLMLDNPDLQQIAETGALSPLTDYGISTEGYADGVLDAGTYDGEVYGLAPTVNTIALFYDRDALAAAGIAPPTTWAELTEAAAELTEGDRYGLAFAAPAAYEGAWQFLPFMWSNGGDERDIATDGTAEALQLMTDFVADGSASRSVVNWTQADVNDQFMAGRAAMMVNGPWQIPALQADSDVDYGIATLPVPEAGDTPVAPLGGEVWTVPRTGDAEKQALAAQVVECLNTDENQLDMATKRFTIPSKTAVATEFGQQVPEEQVFVDLVADARARTAQLGVEWPTQATKIYTAVQSALTGQATPSRALERAEEG
ncbi:extracellular solute-binding protein [Frigoribacterium sp. PvP032]|uniref:sugar ABC transporter substrate-binding protein n=1 Tax=Frigoribacterium sp. PvP032 TaxID=2806589 RepID=UPI001AE9A5BB|nr:extracellular solute-binding protein [Frigoribacterium sp. PvP032]MBP1189405.1 multiple sugar transport system substrate-binding protein [Frigoribacterium sp. PvP032]